MLCCAVLCCAVLSKLYQRGASLSSPLHAFSRRSGRIRVRSRKEGLCGNETAQSPSDVVPVVGLEPTRCRHRRILNPLRLPFHHTGIVWTIIVQRAGYFKREVHRLTEIKFCKTVTAVSSRTSPQTGVAIRFSPWPRRYCTMCVTKLTTGSTDSHVGFASSE